MSHPAPKVHLMATPAHPTIAPRTLAANLKATLISVSAGIAVAAAIALSLGPLFRSTCYHAILHAGGSQLALSGSSTGIFIPDDAASPSTTAWVIGYHTSILLALVIGVAVGARIAILTSRPVASILGSPGDAATHAKAVFGCITRATAATLITLVLTLAAGILIFITAIMFPAAITALAEALPLPSSPGPAAFSGAAIFVGAVIAIPASLLIAHPIERRVQTWTSP